MHETPVSIRAGKVRDAACINEIYNWYVDHSTITFDVEPWSTTKRQEWAMQFEQTHTPYHLFVALDQKDKIVGFSYNAVFRPKAAYDLTTEVTIYTRQPEAPKGTGTLLYQALFAAISKTALHRAYAVISQPNMGSVRFHQKFNFHHIGTLTEVGTKFGDWIDVAWYEKELN